MLAERVDKAMGKVVVEKLRSVSTINNAETEQILKNELVLVFSWRVQTPAG